MMDAMMPPDNLQNIAWKYSRIYQLEVQSNMVLSKTTESYRRFFIVCPKQTDSGKCVSLLAHCSEIEKP
jgi:hypothetical protein